MQRRWSRNKISSTKASPLNILQSSIDLFFTHIVQKAHDSSFKFKRSATMTLSSARIICPPGIFKLLVLLLSLYSAFASLVSYERRSRVLDNGDAWQEGERWNSPRGRALREAKGHRMLPSGQKGSSKGSSKGGSKGGAQPPTPPPIQPRLKTVNIYARKSDVIPSFIQGTDGYTASFPVYSRGQPVGRWYETLTYTSPAAQDGFGSISITFDQDTILTLSSVSSNILYPIIGGSGAFQNCVSGYVEVTGENPRNVYLRINIFETC
jgi:hypothetical protein